MMSRHPALYTALIVPFGAVGGFIGVVLAHLATKQGLTVEEGATLIAVGMLPHTWKFLWAPVVDTTLSRRAWYLLSAVACIAGIVALASVPLGPKTLNLMRLVIFVVNVATTTLGMAVEGLMAHLAPPEERGRIGGWFQAGNLGGNGVGGGFGLWMATHLPSPWMSGAALGLLFALCGLAVFLLPDVPREGRGAGLWDTVKDAAKDVWRTVSSQGGRLAALICFLPVGTGALMGVMAQATVAERWGAGEGEVGLVNGILSGVIAAAGCVVGGELCKRWPSRNVYIGVGALMALVAAGMGVLPLSVGVFIGAGLVYSFVTGLAYAAFTGLVLETIGGGAAATKYNAYASLSNTPIAYMGLVLAWFAEHHGPRSLVFAEAGAGLIGIVIFGAVARALSGARAKAVATA
jgi:MFS family permease